MADWPSSRARRVLAALYRIGWQLKRETCSHKTLARDGWPDVVFAFDDGDASALGCSPASRSAPA